jgi:hypothetical protein
VPKVGKVVHSPFEDITPSPETNKATSPFDSISNLSAPNVDPTSDPANFEPSPLAGPLFDDDEPVVANNQFDLSRVSAPGSVPLEYTVEKASSGLCIFRSTLFLPTEETPFRASLIVQSLMRALPCVFIAHFQKWQQEISAEQLAKTTPLFDWIPAETAREFTPVSFKIDDLPDFMQMIDQAWDKDATIVCFGANAEKLQSHLGQLIHYNMKGMPDSGQMLGYCWPSVMSQFLTVRDSDFVSKLLADVLTAVLMEVPDLPEAWQIIADESFEAVLKKIGFKKAT